MVWILLTLIGVAVLIHLSTRGKSSKERLSELQAQNQKSREDFEARFGRKPSF